MSPGCSTCAVASGAWKASARTNVSGSPRFPATPSKWQGTTTSTPAAAASPAASSASQVPPQVLRLAQRVAPVDRQDRHVGGQLADRVLEPRPPDRVAGVEDPVPVELDQVAERALPARVVEPEAVAAERRRVRAVRGGHRVHARAGELDRLARPDAGDPLRGDAGRGERAHVRGRQQEPRRGHVGGDRRERLGVEVVVVRVRDADQVDALDVVGLQRRRHRPRDPGAALQRGREPRIDEHEPAAGPQRVAGLAEREQRGAGGGRERVAEAGHQPARFAAYASRTSPRSTPSSTRSRRVRYRQARPVLCGPSAASASAWRVEAVRQVQHEVGLARGEPDREPLGGAPVGVAHRVAAEADDARAPHPRPLPGLLRHQLAERPRRRRGGRRPRPTRGRPTSASSTVLAMRRSLRAGRRRRTPARSVADAAWRLPRRSAVPCAPC